MLRLEQQGREEGTDLRDGVTELCDCLIVEEKGVKRVKTGSIGVLGHVGPWSFLDVP
jgi:hypothetical protein